MLPVAISFSADLVGLVLASAALFYWGGQMHANLRALRQITSDHEGRIRNLEGVDG